MAEYVAEIWIDPVWYRSQNPPDPIPSLARPRIVPLSESGVNRIGRATTDPAIDCGLDSGVSRSHAELAYRNGSWWVTDNGSANGTFVGLAHDSCPTDPITGPTEVTSENRIYLGCWTRIVIRPAMAAEIN